MRPRSPEGEPSDDLFRAQLSNQLDGKHPLVRASRQADAADGRAHLPEAQLQSIGRAGTFWRQLLLIVVARAGTLSIAESPLNLISGQASPEPKSLMQVESSTGTGSIYWGGRRRPVDQATGSHDRGSSRSWRGLLLGEVAFSGSLCFERGACRDYPFLEIAPKCDHEFAGGRNDCTIAMRRMRPLRSPVRCRNQQASVLCG